MDTRNRVTMTKSQIAEKLLILDGKPLSFLNYPFIRTIYDGGYRTILLKTGRQVSKSTTLANFILVESAIVPYFKTMFVSPTEFQTAYFSDSRLGKSLNDSTTLRKYLLSGSKVKNNIAVKHFANGANIVFRYASDNPDRARGFTADHLCYDEIQDMHASVFEIINECTTMSDYGFKTFAGTPKSVENVIEIFWQDSSQNEWVMKCEGCNHWNVPTVDNISNKGVVCKKCSKKLNVRNGQWISMSGVHSFYEGFHIPQIILPWHTESDERWGEILKKKRDYPDSTFLNEVMGESDSSGTRLLSLQELRDSCVGFQMNPHEDIRGTHTVNDFRRVISSRRYTQIVAGIDWSGGGRGVKMTDGTWKSISRNAITILGIKGDGVAEVIAHKIFASDVTQPNAVKEMIRVCALYKVSYIGADAGEGNLGNGLLREEFGHHKVIPFRYSGNLSATAKWNQNAETYVIHKTKMIDNVLMCMKRKKILFSNPEDCKEIFDDILAEYEETSGAGVKTWTHSPRTPDDSLHSILFAYCVHRATKGSLHLQYGEEFLQNI